MRWLVVITTFSHFLSPSLYLSPFPKSVSHFVHERLPTAGGHHRLWLAHKPYFNQAADIHTHTLMSCDERLVTLGVRSHPHKQNVDLSEQPVFKNTLLFCCKGVCKQELTQMRTIWPHGSGAKSFPNCLRDSWNCHSCPKKLQDDLTGARTANTW